MDRMFIVSPTTRVWNHKPSNGPMSIASRRLSRSGSSVSKSMLVSPMITPALWLTTACVASKTPMTIFHVFVTMRMAKADLNIQRKNMELSKSDEYCQDGFSNGNVNTLRSSSSRVFSLGFVMVGRSFLLIGIEKGQSIFSAALCSIFSFGVNYLSTNTSSP